MRESLGNIEIIKNNKKKGPKFYIRGKYINSRINKMREKLILIMKWRTRTN